MKYMVWFFKFLWYVIKDWIVIFGVFWSNVLIILNKIIVVEILVGYGVWYNLWI